MAFKAKTFPLEFAAQNAQDRIKALEQYLTDGAIIYIDYGNVRGWKDSLGWQVDLAKLKDFLDSFGVSEVRFYFGTIAGDRGSEKFMHLVHKLGYKVRTKRLKKISVSIDVTNVRNTSKTVLKSVVHQSLLREMSINSVESLNGELSEINKRGITKLELWKCNFDVEIASDMRIHHQLKRTTRFCLISGDSDFSDPLTELLNGHCQTSLIGTSRHIASEINALQSSGLKIFDIKPLRHFIEKT